MDSDPYTDEGEQASRRKLMDLLVGRGVNRTILRGCYLFQKETGLKVKSITFYMEDNEYTGYRLETVETIL